MPKTRKSVASRKKITTSTIGDYNSASANLAPTLPSLQSRKYMIIGGVILIIAALVYANKGLFISATVNGKPITRLTLERELNDKFGSQTLDSLISEQIILDGAHQKGVFVSSAEIDQRIKDIETRLQGKISLSDALKAQGLTPDSFRKQVEIQLTIDKMFDKEAAVSNKEIDDYIAQNQSNLTSTDPAQLRQEAKANLMQQKVGDLFDKWFADQKKNAKVVKF